MVVTYSCEGGRREREGGRGREGGMEGGGRGREGERLREGGGREED